MDDERKLYTRNSKVIKASCDDLYRAFLDPEALLVWLVPDGMSGEIHSFDLRIGGGYVMSLQHPPSSDTPRYKTSSNERRFSVKYVDLSPSRKIVHAIIFNSADPDFSGEMIMEVAFQNVDSETEVTVKFTDIPSDIRLDDREKGVASTLERLARYVGG